MSHVTADQTTALATVQTLDPIYVDITQSSAELLNLKLEMQGGHLTRNGPGDARVTLQLDNGTQYAQAGTLQFSEVTVDPGTGAVTLRAVFPNESGLLLPGMFVREQLREGIREDGILAPQQGVTHNARGDATALVVGADGKVQSRILITDRAIGNDWLVTEGLNAGDRLIVRGVQMVQPGIEVTANEVKLDADPTRPAGSSPASPAAQ